MEKQGNWNTLCAQIGYFFKDPKLLFEAFTHPSLVTVTQKSKRKSYQRLEHVGDGVIDLAAREKLYYKFPDAAEGELVEHKSRLVCGARLTVVARKLELGSYLQIAPSQSKEGLRQNERVLACLVESLVGAMFLDCGGLYLPVSQMMDKYVFADLNEVLGGDGKDFDPKSFMQKLAQEKFGSDVNFQTISQEGPEHNSIWTEAVFIGKNKLAEAQAKSKLEAQKQACIDALAATENLTVKLPYGLIRMKTLASDLEFEAR